MSTTMKYSLVVLVICLHISTAYGEVDSDEVVKVTIFYESLCPDSVDFFKKQFKPNYLAFRDYLEYEFVPYGHASQDNSTGDWEFTCQHGPKECLQNKFQACAIHYYGKIQPINLAGFITCYMAQMKKHRKLGSCARNYEMDVSKIKKCGNSKLGGELLAKFGNQTHDFKPTIRFVPEIVFNDVYDEEEQDQAIDNFKALVCKMLDYAPKKCKNKKNKSRRYPIKLPFTQSQPLTYSTRIPSFVTQQTSY